jgi:glycosidase
MSFVADTLSGQRPSSLDQVRFPRRQINHPSPVDWRNEVLYFLLVDRFSDGQETGRPVLDRNSIQAARPAGADGSPWSWQRWVTSGRNRWQGGTIAGVGSKLGYLRDLGITTLWLSPVFRQRAHLDTYHGYGVQDFLDVDPRFGTREDLVQLVADAHGSGMRILLDIIFNHSGSNWLYPAGTPGGRQKAAYTSGRYPFGAWRGRDGTPAPGGIVDRDDGVWPTDLQDEDAYTRAGSGSLGAGDIGDPNAEHKRSDFEDLRDLALDRPGVLNDLVGCYKYWIALTDCDGFRIDTLKHVSLEQARNFCGAIREFAANLGKENFLLLGEVAGGDLSADHYLDALERNLSAALDIGEARPALTAVAKGLVHPSEYFRGFDPALAVLGSHRILGNRHVSILDDHDHVFGPKLRFATGAASSHQAVAGVAIQLFTLGIPCVYYGTEQGFAGPEPSEWRFLDRFGGSDVYLREAMFGPEHPKADGLTGLAGGADTGLPGFGAFGTSGRHCFDPAHGAYRRIAALSAVRAAFPVLRHGRQYLRPISLFGGPFDVRGGGELLAWSRILDDEEAVCVVNTHGTAARGADVLVDAGLNAGGAAEFRVIANAGEASGASNPAHPVGSAVPVKRRSNGTTYIALRDCPASEVIVLVNR